MSENKKDEKEVSKAMGNALESILALSFKEWPEDVQKHFDRLFDDLRGLINENTGMYEALKEIADSTIERIEDPAGIAESFVMLADEALPKPTRTI